MAGWRRNDFGQIDIADEIAASPNTVASFAGSWHKVSREPGEEDPKASGSFPGLGGNLVIGIDSGDDQNIAILTAGDILGWGDNASGQLDLPDDLPEVEAVAAGLDYTQQTEPLPQSR